MSIAADRVDLSDHDAELLAQASRLMNEALDRSEAGRITLVEENADGSDIARLEVPPATLRLLSQIFALMARQQTFVLYPESSELTTKQAAEVLGVSRPFLIRVLEAGDIPFRKVGRHRRVFIGPVDCRQCRCSAGRPGLLGGGGGRRPSDRQGLCAGLSCRGQRIEPGFELGDLRRHPARHPARQAHDTAPIDDRGRG